MAKRWSYKSYGRSATRGRLSFEAGGLEEYLKQIQTIGKNVDEAVKLAVHESAKPIYSDMKQGASRHFRTGEVYDAIELSDPIQHGDVIFVSVGIDRDEHEEAIHAVFQEYGAPTFPADPFIRPAFDNNKSTVKRIQREVLKREGMPVD